MVVPHSRINDIWRTTMRKELNDNRPIRKDKNQKNPLKRMGA